MDRGNDERREPKIAAGFSASCDINSRSERVVAESIEPDASQNLFPRVPRKGGAMLEQMETGARSVVGFRFDGEMTDEDYATTLIPALDSAAGTQQGVRILFLIVDFRGWFPRGHWEAFKRWHGIGKVDRIAIVGGEKWEEWMQRLPGLFVGFSGIDVRYFFDNHLEAALDWLREPLLAEEAVPGAV